jgi:hypothetical protein
MNMPKPRKLKKVEFSVRFEVTLRAIYARNNDKIQSPLAKELRQ